jgi:hypothetical protein
MSVTPINAAPADAPIITERGLDRTGKIIAVFAALLTIVLSLAGWYAKDRERMSVMEARQTATERDVTDIKRGQETIQADVKLILQRLPQASGGAR